MTLAGLLELTLGMLAAGTAAGQVLRVRARTESARRTAANINARVASWWVLCGVTGLALFAGDWAVVALFAVFSGLALREFRCGAAFRLPGRDSSRREGTSLAAETEDAPRRVSALQARVPAPHLDAWAAFSDGMSWPLLAIAAAQYAAIGFRWPSVFAVVTPVFGILAVSVFEALRGGPGRFLERAAVSCWGLLVCVWCLSHAPALLMLEIPGYTGRNPTLLFFLLLVVEVSDVMQYVWGKLLGRRPLAPEISPNKTWAGFWGGTLSATALGTVLYRATPFSPWQAAAISAAATLAGVAGGLVMSAVKRDRGIKDFGSLVAGHGGMLDRADSLCFAAPVFYYATKFFFAR